MVFCMVFFGGLLILVVYISRLASNDKTHIKGWKFTLFLPFVVAIRSLTPGGATLMASEDVNVASLLFIRSNVPLLVFIIVYLLVALVVAVKTTFFYKGALREIKY